MVFIMLGVAAARKDGPCRWKLSGTTASIINSCGTLRSVRYSMISASVFLKLSVKASVSNICGSELVSSFQYALPNAAETALL